MNNNSDGYFVIILIICVHEYSRLELADYSTNKNLMSCAYGFYSD